MDQIAVAAFEKDLKFEGFLLVRTSEQRASSNGSKYLDMTLCDRTGDMNAKMWDGTVTPPKVGGVVKVRALVTEYNGRLQLRVNKVREAEEGEYDLSFLVPCAPYPAEDMLKEITDTVDAMRNTVLQKLVRGMLDLAGDKLIYYPAAQRLHHAERSGLLHHTSSMLRLAKSVLPVYPWLDAELLYAGVIVHDLSKIREMKSDEAGNVNDYTTEGWAIWCGALPRCGRPPAGRRSPKTRNTCCSWSTWSSAITARPNLAAPARPCSRRPKCCTGSTWWTPG